MPEYNLHILFYQQTTQEYFLKAFMVSYIIVLGCLYYKIIT